MLERPLLRMIGTMQNGTLTAHGLGLKGLRPVISYLEQHPDKTHLIAVKESNDVHNIIVTPKSCYSVVSDLRRLMGKSNGTARKIESLIQTF